MKDVFKLILSAVISVGIYFLSIKLCLTPNFDKFFELFINAFSILIGFIFTIATILSSYKNEKIEFIRNSGGMSNLYKSLKSTLFIGFIAIFISMTFFYLKMILLK